jgi:hypothetical protein
MGDLYRFDTAESKCGNEIAPSSTTFKRGALTLKTTFLIKYVSGMANLVGQITAYVFVERFISKELQCSFAQEA